MNVLDGKGSDFRAGVEEGLRIAGEVVESRLDKHKVDPVLGVYLADDLAEPGTRSRLVSLTTVRRPMIDAEKRAQAERAQAEKEAANWPVSYQRVNEQTGWLGEVFEFRRPSVLAEAYTRGFLTADTQPVVFTMKDGRTCTVRFDAAKAAEVKARKRPEAVS